MRTILLAAGTIFLLLLIISDMKSLTTPENTKEPEKSDSNNQ